VAPDLGPLLRGFRNGLQRIAEGIGGGLVVLLIEEGFTHAEVGERAIGLNGEGALVLTDGVRSSGPARQALHRERWRRGARNVELPFRRDC